MIFSERIYDSWSGLQKEKYEQIIKYIKPCHGYALDIGAGSGFFESFLKSRGRRTDNFILMDKSKEMLSKASGKRILADAHALPFGPESFSFITCIDTAHLIKDAREIRRVLKPGGCLLVSIFYNDYNKDSRQKHVEELFADFRVVKKVFLSTKEKEIAWLFS